MLDRRVFINGAAVMLVGVAAIPHAFAQSQKATRIVVGFPPGGSTDFVVLGRGLPLRA
jgi:tripartite-type tricarboxylate transporter receptor subunit TctC